MASSWHVLLHLDGLFDAWTPCRCDTTRRTGNVVVTAVREGGVADIQGVVRPTDTVCLCPFAQPASRHAFLTSQPSLQVLAVWHKSVSQGTDSDSWLVFDDHEHGQARLDQIEQLLQLGGPVGLRLCRCALSCTGLVHLTWLLLSVLVCMILGRGGFLARAAISAWTGKRAGDRITSSSVRACLGTSLARQSEDCSAKRIRRASWATHGQRTGGPASKKN